MKDGAATSVGKVEAAGKASACCARKAAIAAAALKIIQIFFVIEFVTGASKVEIVRGLCHRPLRFFPAQPSLGMFEFNDCQLAIDLVC